jgi:xylose dehydrogenase (NAD/NADP)
LTDEVGWGLLGTARINRRIIPAMRADRRSRIVAVASRDAARGAAVAREWDIPYAVGYQDLLRREDVTAIYIPLPNSLHAEWTLAAIDAGKHVLCEKPFVLDPADIDRIAAARDDAGVVVEEGFMYRHEAMTARVASLVSDGAVGSLRTIVAGFCYSQAGPDDVRLDAALGGGALNDVGCYPLSYACLLANRQRTGAMGTARWTDGQVDEEFTALLTFAGGLTASLYAGFRAAPHSWLEVVGTEGTLRVPHPFKPGRHERIELVRHGDAHHFDVEGSALLFQREIEDFVASVLDGVPTVVSLDESRRVASALSMLHAAARQPERVP